MHQPDTKRSLWQKMIWDHCVNDDDKEARGDEAIPNENTVWWYKIEVAMKVALVILMAIPGDTSFGLAWLLLFVFMRAWTVRSTRRGYTEAMNHVIRTSPRDAGTSIQHPLGWSNCMGVGPRRRLHREPVLGIEPWPKQKKIENCERYRRRLFVVLFRPWYYLNDQYFGMCC